MEPQQKKYIAIGLAAVGLIVMVISVVWATRSDAPDESGLPQETYWVCANPTCGNTFMLTRKQLAKHQDAHPDAPAPPCPKCGKNETIAATKCPHCGTIYPSGGRGRTVCPKCGKTPVST